MSKKNKNIIGDSKKCCPNCLDVEVYVYHFSTSDREYNPDIHCGVICKETEKPCTRSLTCKVRLRKFN